MNAATKSTSLGVLSGLFAFILLSWLSPPTNTATDASRMRRLLLRLDGIAASLEDIAHAQHSVTMELTTRYPDLGKVAGTLLLGTPGLGGSPAPAPVTSAAPAAFGGAAPQPAPVSGTPQPQYSAPVVDADAAQLDQLKKELMEAERREEVVAHEQSAFESAKRFIMDADLVEIASVAIANRNDPRVGPLVRECGAWRVRACQYLRALSPAGAASNGRAQSASRRTTTSPHSRAGAAPRMTTRSSGARSCAT